MVSIQSIKDTVRDLAPQYGIKNAKLFGSYAAGNAHSQSDVDLLLEFDMSGISLIKLSEIKYRLQDKLGIEVDLIHGPLPNDSLLLINQTVMLYDA